MSVAMPAPISLAFFHDGDGHHGRDNFSWPDLAMPVSPGTLQFWGR